MNETLNNTLACSSFVSLTDLLSETQAAHVNLTIEVQVCPDLCTLAWGQGNPDLSGVGANISWIFQAVLTILLGPCLPLAKHFVPSSAKYMEERLEDLHKDFLNASIFIALPVAVATIAYLKQVDFLFEVTFLYYLTTMQFLALLGTALAGIIFAPENLEKRPRPWVEQSVVTTLSCILSFGLYLGALEWIRESSVPQSLLPQLISACQAYGKIVPSLPSFTKLSFHIINKLYTTIYTKVMLPLGGLIVILGCVGYYFRAFMLVLAHPVSNALVTLAFSIGMLYCLIVMQVKRNAMRAVAGPAYQDNNWGFGQILSVFVWIPIAFKIFLWVLELIMVSNCPISWEWKDDSLRQRSTRGTLQRQSTEHFISSSEREPPPEGRDSNEGPRPSTENQGLKTPVSGEESPQHYEAIPLDEIAVAY